MKKAKVQKKRVNRKMIRKFWKRNEKIFWKQVFGTQNSKYKIFNWNKSWDVLNKKVWKINIK